ISPVDVDLVRGAPHERRRYLDVVLATTSRRYLVALQEYRSALLRRNAALRQGANEAAAAVWEPPLAESGAIVRSERSAWVERWSTSVGRITTAIGEPGPVTLRYACGPDVRASSDVAGWRDVLARALEEGRATDVRRAMTRVGPHRDDLVLAIDGK